MFSFRHTSRVCKYKKILLYKMGQKVELQTLVLLHQILMDFADLKNCCCFSVTTQGNTMCTCWMHVIMQGSF